MPPSPSIVIIAGPNGAGKTTISRAVLADTLGIEHFVNADAIAAGLSGFSPEAAAFPAGRIMLARLRELAAARESFAFESTLASRTFAPWLADCAANGYRISLIYVMLRSANLAVDRVAARFASGGHTVPEADMRRRFNRSARNALQLYIPLMHAWQVVENSGAMAQPVAFGFKGKPATIRRPDLWEMLHDHANTTQTDER